jgi:hypothetical protein
MMSRCKPALANVVLSGIFSEMSESTNLLTVMTKEISYLQDNQGQIPFVSFKLYFVCQQLTTLNQNKRV